MFEPKDEYLMLRDEILHLDTIVSNTITFFLICSCFIFSRMVKPSIPGNMISIQIISYSFLWLMM